MRMCIRAKFVRGGGRVVDSCFSSSLTYRVIVRVLSCVLIGIYLYRDDEELLFRIEGSDLKYEPENRIISDVNFRVYRMKYI